MKRFIVALALVLFAFPALSLGEEKEKFPPQQFKTTITITYNSLSLEEAAVKEKMIKSFCQDACEVDIGLSDGNYSTLTVTADGNWLITPN